MRGGGHPLLHYVEFSGSQEGGGGVCVVTSVVAIH
jgi:hypothetical protein